MSLSSSVYGVEVGLEVFVEFASVLPILTTRCRLLTNKKKTSPQLSIRFGARVCTNEAFLLTISSNTT